MAGFLLGEFLVFLVFHHIQFIIRVTPAQAEDTDRIAAKWDKHSEEYKKPPTCQRIRSFSPYSPAAAEWLKSTLMVVVHSFQVCVAM